MSRSPDSRSPTTAPRPAPWLHGEATPTGSINSAQPSTQKKKKGTELKRNAEKKKKRRQLLSSSFPTIATVRTTVSPH